MRAWIRLVFTAAWVACVLLRVDLFQSYGKGTGVDKLYFSPLDVASQFSMRSARVRAPKAEQPIRSLWQAVGVPGEAFLELKPLLAGSGGKTPPTIQQLQLNPQHLVEQSAKWTKNTHKMKRVLDPKDQVSGFASLVCVAATLAALFRPKHASLVFVASLVVLQFGLQTFERSARLEETWGFYSLALAAVSALL